MKDKEKLKLSEIKSIVDELVKEELKEVNYTKDSSGKDVIAVGAPGSVVRFAIEHPELIKGMRMWINNCSFGDSFEKRKSLDNFSDEQVLQHIKDNYDDGVKGFLRDYNSKSQVPIGMNNEGVGYVTNKDMAKDPKHIKGERWRIKFQSDGDLKKHGNTEMSKVNEDKIKLSEIKTVIKELVDEMWDSRNDVEGDETHGEDVFNDMAGEGEGDDVNETPQYEGTLQEPFKSNQDITDLANPKIIHYISKPVRKPETNEWVVKWMINGKRDENKTYYTDDKRDAFDTYKQMVKHAGEMNKSGK